MNQISIPRFLQTLAQNAVPAWGFFGASWSDATVLAVYWGENLMSVVLIGVRIAIHRALTHKRGHDFAMNEQGLKPGEKPALRKDRPWTFLQGFLIAGIVFTLAQGLFLALILTMLLPKMSHGSAGLDMASAVSGLKGMGGVLLAGFVMDMFAIRTQPFAWIRQMAEWTMGRVILVHLVIIFGMAAMAWFGSPRGLFGLFIALKVMSEFGACMPEYNPKEPPKWMNKVMTRIGPKGQGDFATFWKASDEDKAKRRAQDEEAA